MGKCNASLGLHIAFHGGYTLWLFTSGGSEIFLSRGDIFTLEVGRDMLSVIDSCCQIGA